MWTRQCCRAARHPPHYTAILPLRQGECRARIHNHVISDPSVPKWTRGAKRISKATLTGIPQGPLPKRVTTEEDIPKQESPMYPTVIQQALNNMRKFSNCVVLTRVGNFYELYFDQAETYSKLLNLKLAMKPISLGRKVPMSGFPYFQLDRYLKVLVQDLNKYVAIVEEVPVDVEGKIKSGGLMFDRKVARVITPGTLIDEKFMDPWENNFVLGLCYNQTANSDNTIREETAPEKVAEDVAQELGLAWLDLSSGDFFTQKTTIDSLSSVLARIGPREIVIDPVITNDHSSPISSILSEGQYIITRYSHTSNPAGLWNSLLQDRGEGVNYGDFSEHEIEAGSFLLGYVDTRLQGNLPNLRPPMQRNHEDYMTIDRNSLKALEIRQTMRDGGLEGSLLHAVRRTVTKSGHRLLCQRLMSPSTSIQEINERLDLVTELLEHETLREDVVTLLTLTFDSWRLLQKFSFGRGDADDLVSLARTIRLTGEIRDVLDAHATNDLSVGTATELSNTAMLILGRSLELEKPSKLADRILDSIDEDKLSEQHKLEDDHVAAVVDLAEGVLSSEGEELKGIPKTIKGRRAAAGVGIEADKDKDNTLPPEVWIMRPSASTVLKKLHNQYSALLQDKEQLSIELREKSGAQSLNLKWTPGLGHIIHLKGKDAAASLASLDLGNVRPVSSSKSTRSFHHPLWTQLGGRLDDARIRIRAEESKVFARLREQVIENLVLLRRNAALLDQLDVASSFATLAHERKWTRPILNYGLAHEIIGGRHPTVEANLTLQGRTFTPNDCVVGSEKATSPNPRILLITGPNMAGKSTFLRQNALISILAQTGSYVPAAYASIGIVDAVLSRVGSADSLHSDQSTFMVEMLETAHILRIATPRSFVVMDEVGRGTTPEDGIAVSYAALEHLATKNKCRSLFATHFHVLADMTRDWESVECLCTDVVEDVGDAKGWSFVHKVRKGVNRESHALKVARLAGMPESVVASARAVLEGLRMDIEDRRETLTGRDLPRREAKNS